MGIGTSLGAYFENDFNHQAGIEQKDDNVVTPDQMDQNKQMDKIQNDELGGTEVGLKGTALSDSLIKEFEAFRKMGKPYRDQRDGAIAKPEPPPPDNVTMIHPIGYFKDRSQEPIDLNPMNDTENGVIGMGQTGGEGPSVFNTFMATRGRRQQSNIVPHPTEETVAPRPQEEAPAATPVLAGRPVDHPDFTRLVDEHYNALVEHSANAGPAWQPRGIREGETMREFAEREVNRADPDLRYRGHLPEEPIHEPMHDQDMFRQEPFIDHEAGTSIGPYAVRQAREKLLDYKSSDAPEIKKGSIGLKVDRDNGYRQELNFYHEPTNTVGSLDISERQGGKQLYVHGIGLNENISPNSLGKKAMRDLIEALKEQYPNAETIKGFRVSGARFNSRSGSADAEMRIRPPRQTAQEDDISNYLGATNAHRF